MLARIFEMLPFLGLRLQKTGKERDNLSAMTILSPVVFWSRREILVKELTLWEGLIGENDGLLGNLMGFEKFGFVIFGCAACCEVRLRYLRLRRPL